MNCPTCGYENPEGVPGCLICGADMVIKPAEPALPPAQPQPAQQPAQAPPAQQPAQAPPTQQPLQAPQSPQQAPQQAPQQPQTQQTTIQQLQQMQMPITGPIHDPYYQPPKKDSKKNIVIVGSIILAVVVIIAALILMVPEDDVYNEETETQTIQLKVNDIEGGSYFLYETPSNISVKVTIINSVQSKETADGDKITITVKTNIDSRNYTWSEGDLQPGDFKSINCRVLANKDTGSVSVSVYYDGERHDTRSIMFINF